MKAKSISKQFSGTFARRSIFVIIIMLAMLTDVKSQQNATSQDEVLPPKYRWGVKGGLNNACEYNDKGTTNYRTGVHLGFFMESTLSNKVDIQPEFVYSMQGGVDSNGYTDKIDYINVPVIFKIYVNQTRTFSIDLGAQLGYMISAKYTHNNYTVSIYDSSRLNKFDAAICVGASYKFNPAFHIGLRYNYSGTTIMDGNNNRNGVVQLGVGYMF